MVGVELEKDIRKMKGSDIIKRLMVFTKPYKNLFYLALFFSLLSVLVGLVEPLVLEFSINFLNSPDFIYKTLAKALVMYAFILIVGVGVTYLSTILLQKVGQRIIYDIRDRLFTHMEDFSIDYFNDNQVGRLVNRATADVNSMSNLFTNIIVNVLKSILQVVTILIIMFIKSPKITLIALCFIPLVFIISFFFGKYARKIYRMIRNQASTMTALLAESLSGMKIIQSFNQEEEKMKQFEEENDKYLKLTLKQLFIYSVYRPGIHIIYMSSVMCVYLVGGIEVLNGTLLIGTLFLMTQYITKFFQPIQQLADQYDLIQASFAASERIFAILDTEKSVKEEGKNIMVDHLEGEIEFKHVWFAYKDEEWILKDVSFKVPAKTSCAFVGATGAGKTTILSLITRNYDVQKGEVLIDGVNVKDYNINSLRKCIGQMLQDVYLFSGTIKSNITLKSDKFSDEEVVEACHYVNANHFIDKLENKYDEEVRERGNNFSTGQKQLLSFARTMVHKPNVMILDEATSNIDTETEQLIQESLKNMMNVGTMLMVAHRLSTIQSSDQIIVLDHGVIKEKGSHQELLKLKGDYYRLYRIQFEEKEED